MTISELTTTDKPILEARRLLLAMSPIDIVLESFCSHSLLEEEKMGSLTMGLGKQDEFAKMVKSCWTDFGPSERYLKRLIMQFVRLSEKNGADIESDLLANLVAEASLVNSNGAPDTLESCYVSFFLDCCENSNGNIPLKIRVFPHHNDVSLRLWEAGNSLAEFFIENPAKISDKALIELGSGCGATGLAIAACCEIQKIHLTDYTEACQLNLEHNLSINNEWLSHHNFSPERISQGYLEWEAFARYYPQYRNGVDGTADTEETIQAFRDTFEAFSQADILIAADVIYDRDYIDPLINVVKWFLAESPTSKQAIFSSTKRNVATFEFFLETIGKYGLTYTWLARNEECESLRRIFYGNYAQKRCDVQICSIHMT